MTRQELQDKCEEIYDEFRRRLREGAPHELAIVEMRQRSSALLALYHCSALLNHKAAAPAGESSCSL
jgi:hypothetical protein